MNKSANPPPFSFRELARVRFEALRTLLVTQGEDIDLSVHNARRQLKQLRALLRLFRALLGEELFALGNSSLREAGRLLGPLRDAKVRLELLESRAHELKSSALGRAITVAGTHLRQAYDEVMRDHPPAGVFAKATELLAPARQRLLEWQEPEGSPLVLCQEGLRTSYRQSRKGLFQALSLPTVENLHEWRKRGKDLRYQLEFLDTANPQCFRDQVALLRRLSDALGHHHDLFVLRETLASQVRKELKLRQLLALHETLEARQRSTLDEAVAVGSRLLAAKPAEFLSTMEAAWQKNRRQP